MRRRLHTKCVRFGHADPSKGKGIRGETFLKVGRAANVRTVSLTSLMNHQKFISGVIMLLNELLKEKCVLTELQVLEKVLCRKECGPFSCKPHLSTSGGRGVVHKQQE